MGCIVPLAIFSEKLRWPKNYRFRGKLENKRLVKEGLQLNPIFIDFLRDVLYRLLFLVENYVGLKIHVGGWGGVGDGRSVEGLGRNC